MMTEPGYSPWGEIQHCDMLTPGIYSVSTAGHGGIMARMDVARKTLSKALLTAHILNAAGIALRRTAPLPWRCVS